MNISLLRAVHRGGLRREINDVGIGGCSTGFSHCRRSGAWPSGVWTKIKWTKWLFHPRSYLKASSLH